MAERICLMTFYPTKCKDDCFNCDCGGQGATKDMYVSINNVQRVCAIQGNAADTNEGAYIAEVIRNNLELMVEDAPNIDRWISCKERMPEDNVPVLFALRTKGGIQPVLYGWHYSIKGLGSAWHQSGCGGARADEDVTHWQPIPKPPKED